MTKVLVDRIETQQDGLRFGDPIGCHYHWTEPDEVDAYGDSVRRLAGKVELAVDAFERTATLSEDVFAGEAADTLRERAGRRHEESVLVRDNLRGLGRAINAYSDVLRRHREGLEQLRAYAVSARASRCATTASGPRSRPSPATPRRRRWTPGSATGRPTRSASTPRSSCVTPAGPAPASWSRRSPTTPTCTPTRTRQKLVAANANQVKFGDLRREAAEEAMEAVQANDAVRRRPPHGRRPQATRAVRPRRPREDGPRGEAARGDPGPGRQGRRRSTASSSRPASRPARPRRVADREQAQANRAARNLEAAEAGPAPAGRRAVRGSRWAARPANLKDRLG